MKSNCSAANQRIKKLAGRINELASQAVSLYSREADLIIVSGCKDKRRIERILEGILDFCFDKGMLELYRKLCRYYYDINPRGAVEYVYAYRDMWDEEILRSASAKSSTKPKRLLPEVSK